MNTAAYREKISAFFQIAKEERAAIVLLGNSQTVYMGHGWDHGWQYAAKKRSVLFGGGLISINEGSGYGAGTGYFYGALGTPNAGFTGAPSQLEAYLNKGSGALTPYNYYYSASGGTNNALYCSLGIITNNVQSGPFVPAMTSNSQSGFTASASSESDAFHIASVAFNGSSPNDGWTATTQAAWLQITAPQAYFVTSYTIGNWPFGGRPVNWTIKGSNDGGSTFTVVDTRTGADGGASASTTFTVANPGSYSTFRLDITTTNGAQPAAVSEWTLIARTDGDPDSPWDARDGFKVTQTYGTFPSGTANYKPAFGPDGTNGVISNPLYSVTTATVNAVTGSYGLQSVTMTLAPDATRTGKGTYRLSPYTVGQGNGGGQQFLLYNQFEQPARTTGVSVTVLDYRGCQTLRTIINDLQQASDLTLTTALSLIRAPLGPRKAMLFVWLEMQNSIHDNPTDAGDGNPALHMSLGTNPAIGSTAAGYLDNMQAGLTRLNQVFDLNGWSKATKFDLIMGDHATADPDNPLIVSFRQICATQIAAKVPNVSVVDLSQQLTGTELTLLGYYDTGQTAHQMQKGYEQETLKVWDLYDQPGAAIFGSGDDMREDFPSDGTMPTVALSTTSADVLTIQPVKLPTKVNVSIHVADAATVPVYVQVMCYPTLLATPFAAAAGPQLFKPGNRTQIGAPGGCAKYVVQSWLSAAGTGSIDVQANC